MQDLRSVLVRDRDQRLANNESFRYQGKLSTVVIPHVLNDNIQGAEVLPCHNTSSSVHEKVLRCIVRAIVNKQRTGFGES